MTTQDTYSERMGPPSPGSIHGSDYDTETGICETASPGIPFGRVVAQGTLSDQGRILGGAADTYRGISVRDIALGAEQDAYLPPNGMSVIVRGEVWVEPSHAVAAGDAVYFTAATGVLTNQSSGNVLVKGARWTTSCGTGGTARLKLSGYSRSG